MTKDIHVTITDWEYWNAVQLGNLRMAISNERKLNHASTYKRTYSERLKQEVIGACGEIALCKAMGWYWSPTVNTFHYIADVKADIEVRATEESDGSLIFRDNDHDDRWYVLVTGVAPNFIVRGRIKGSDCKRDEWLRNPHGHRQSFFVPQGALSALPTKVQLAA